MFDRFIFFVCCLCAALLCKKSDAESVLNWRQLAEGVSLTEYNLGEETGVLPSKVYILRSRPAAISLRAVSVNKEAKGQLRIKDAVARSGALAGINASFFDPDYLALGVVIIDGKPVRPLQQGGSLLTGVFAIKGNGEPIIVHRSAFSGKNVSHAVQSGPRLISKGAPLRIRNQHVISRRSGVAITSSGDLLLYATQSRIPGASLQQITEMLLDPRLDVQEALNLDGGRSSQLYVSARGELTEAIDIFGGHDVPVGLLLFADKQKTLKQ